MGRLLRWFELTFAQRRHASVSRGTAADPSLGAKSLPFKPKRRPPRLRRPPDPAAERR